MPARAPPDLALGSTAVCRPVPPRATVHVISPFQPPQVAELEPDDDEEHGQHEQRDGRALAEQTGGDADLIGVRREEVGGIGRPAARQHVDELEVRERLNDREHHDHDGHRLQERPRHVPEALPAVCAVERRRLLQVRADGLQAREQRDGEERHPAPRIDHDGAPHAVGAVGEERELGRDEAGLVEQPVEHAEGGIEHPSPREGAEHGGHDERQEHGGAHDPLAAEVPVEQERQPHPQRQLEEGGPERVEAGVPECGPEDRVVPRLDEIVQADEDPDIAHAGVGQREPHAHHERIGDEQAEEDDRRGEQDEREQPLVFEDARPSRRPGGAGMGKDGLEPRRPSRSARDGLVHELPFFTITRRSS